MPQDESNYDALGFVILDDGHNYKLLNAEGGEPQHIAFIKKEPVEGSTELRVVQNGTTNEAVIGMLISRMRILQQRLPSELNERAIHYLGVSLELLQLRTKQRKERGVEGTHQA